MGSIRTFFVIHQADGSGVPPEDAFATAEGYDEDKGRYLGLRVGHGVPSAIDNQTCLVKVSVARKQMEVDAKAAGKPVEPGTGNEGTITGPSGGAGAVVDGEGGTGDAPARSIHEAHCFRWFREAQRSPSWARCWPHR
jgi:hypothetical protein